MQHRDDTIAAIATPVGTGGIGIIKLTGPDALSIASRLFQSSSFSASSPETHRLYYGTIIDPDDRCRLDDVLLSYMKSPSSYTGDDVVEINCHSGLVILRKILDLVIRGGARLAEPGEFTKRAFLNGRIDLTQAEAVIDVIDAKTENYLKLASRHLRGDLAQKTKAFRETLLEISAHIEVSIDFPEDEIDAVDTGSLARKTAGLSDMVKQLLSTFDQGNLYRMGIQAVIVGKPNVGKSSLLNALLGDTRAIVTSIPGTTRDTIQETITIEGVPVRLTDTAGLRSSQNEIEQMGIDMTMSKLADADLVLVVLDGSDELDPRDRTVSRYVKGKKAIAVINKSDLHQHLSADDLNGLFSSHSIVKTSALHGRGIDELKQAIYQTAIHNSHDISSDILLCNARHKSILERTQNSLQAVFDGLCNGLAPELISVDLQAALHALGELSGETTADDVLDMIFSKFCIGK